MSVRLIRGLTVLGIEVSAGVIEYDDPGEAQDFAELHNLAVSFENEIVVRGRGSENVWRAPVIGFEIQHAKS